MLEIIPNKNSLLLSNSQQTMKPKPLPNLLSIFHNHLFIMLLIILSTLNSSQPLNLKVGLTTVPMALHDCNDTYPNNTNCICPVTRTSPGGDVITSASAALELITNETCPATLPESAFVAELGTTLIYDAAVADMTITYNRSLDADFTERSKNAWIFLKQLTPILWLGSLAFFVFTGAVIWALEHHINDELRGPPTNSALLPLREPSRQTMKPCFDRVDILAKALMAAFGIIVVAALSRYKDIVQQPPDSLILTTALFLILTLVFGYVLWLYVNYMYNQVNLTNWQYMLHVALVSFGGVCLMCTIVMLLAFVNPVNALLSCFLVVVPFVIGMLAYAGSRINGNNRLARDQVFEATMKSCCDVAYLTIGGDFSMHVAVIFVYYKNIPSLRVNQLPSVDISATFLASMLGVFSMMVTAMPLELLPLAVRSKLLFILKFLKYSMLFLTASAAMTLGGEFLDGLVYLVLMPILVVIVAYQTVLLLNVDQVDPDPNNVIEGPENPEQVDRDRNNVNERPENPEQVDRDPIKVNEEPEIPAMLNGVTNTCIVLLSAVYALYTGDENDDVYLRVGIFFLVGIITSCLSWIALVLNPFMNEQRANVTKLVIGILLGLMITISAAFLLKICVDLYDQRE